MRAFLICCQVAGLAATLAGALYGQGGATGYVGAVACSKCHPEQAEAFRSTPMGRSLTAVSSLPDDFLAKPVEYAHAATSRHYRLFRLDETAFIEESFRNEPGEVLYADLRPLDYVIGSGNHARSFLTANRGRLYQSPLTFYAGPGRWEMSPGYDSDVHVGFTRRISGNCLACHTGRLNIEDRANSRFGADEPFAEMAIGCERCHGPGSAHAEDPASAVIQPAKLDGALRDQVCEQCHLFGDARAELPGRSILNYQPGLPLEDFVSVYALAESGSARTSVTGHPLEMRDSRCWQASRGEMWCGSCHQVHTARGGGTAAAFYRLRCLECHDQQPCSRPRETSSQPDTSDCVGCHMPKRSVVESNHVVFTDHRVPRESPASFVAKAGTVLRPIYPPPADESVAQRNLGFAYADLASSTGRQEFYRLVVNILQPLAETSIANAEFRENLGTAYLNLGDLARAEQEFRFAVEKSPGSATAFYSLGFLCQLQGRPTEAIEAYKHAVAIDPQKHEAWGNLAAAYQSVGETGKAKDHLRRALELDPGHLRWRKAWLSLQP
jgi:tetratricopeptide (TPR) repeat protein